MRITKDFLNDCAHHARAMIGKAKEKTEKAFFKKLSEDTFIVPLIRPFGSAEFRSVIDDIRQATKVTSEDAPYIREVKERARDAVLSKKSIEDLDNPKIIAADLMLSPEANSKLGQKLPDGLSIHIGELLALRKDWKDLLIDNQFVMLKDLIKDNGYWTHNIKKFTYNLKDIYTEDEIDELYNTFILREEFSEAYEKICQICRNNYRGSDEPFFQHRTLEQFELDTFVWPIVKDTPIVTAFIEKQEEKARLAKEKREAALREKREREAAIRKAKLEALERGEDPEQAVKQKSDINVSLLKGINKMVD